MSYNVDSADYIKGSGPLYMTGYNLHKIRRATRGNRPESTFLDELEVNPDDMSDRQKIDHPWWNGEGSGNSMEEYIKALEHTAGSADIIVTWEGGDLFTGYRVVDGVVTEHEVVMSLGGRTGT